MEGAEPEAEVPFDCLGSLRGLRWLAAGLLAEEMQYQPETVNSADSSMRFLQDEHIADFICFKLQPCLDLSPLLMP